MSVPLLRKVAPLVDRDAHGFFDDFEWFVTAHRWTKNVADVAGGVGIAVLDAVGGILTLSPEDATDEDEVYLESTTETFLFADGKPISFEARVQFAEANTNKANIFVGMMNAVGADAMVDAGAGPKSSFSGFGFYKVDGGTRWQIIASVGTGRTAVDLTDALSLDGVAKTAGSASYQVLRVDVKPYNSTNCKCDFFINEVHVGSIDLVYTSATEMQVCLGVKNGSTTAETMLCDYVAAFQKR